jgi:hypothetical protein
MDYDRVAESSRTSRWIYTDATETSPVCGGTDALRIFPSPTLGPMSTCQLVCNEFTVYINCFLLNRA